MGLTTHHRGEKQHTAINIAIIVNIIITNVRRPKTTFHSTGGGVGDHDGGACACWPQVRVPHAMYLVVCSAHAPLGLPNCAHIIYNHNQIQRIYGIDPQYICAVRGSLLRLQATFLPFDAYARPLPCQSLGRGRQARRLPHGRRWPSHPGALLLLDRSSARLSARLRDHRLHRLLLAPWA